MKYLIADDDLVSRLALSDLISTQANASIELAENGLAAWEALQQVTAPVMCLLDVRMPEMTGVDVLQKLRQSARFLGWPVMLVTSTPDRESVKDAAQLGVSGFVVKPVEAEALGRITAIAQQFEHSILEPFASKSARLGIDHARYRTYVSALLKQLDTLIADLVRNEVALPELAQRAQKCRSAAVTLGSRHLEMIFSKLIPALNYLDNRKLFTEYAHTLLLTRNQIQVLAEQD